MGSEKNVKDYEPIDGYGSTERQEILRRTSINMLDSDGNVREQATMYIVPDRVSVRGCQSDCVIKFVIGDHQILARRDSEGLVSDCPLIMEHSAQTVDRRAIQISPATRFNFLVIGEHSFVTIFDRGTGAVILGSASPDSILTVRDGDTRI